MKLDLRVFVILLLVSLFSFSQQSEFFGSVDILPVPVDYETVDLEKQNFNPNGVRVFFDSDPNYINLLFKSSISNVLIEVIDKRGRLINNYNANKAGQVKINITRLEKGSYFIRLSSKEIKDFLKFIKEE